VITPSMRNALTHSYACDKDGTMVLAMTTAN
jgi:hypothetical protein